MAGTQQQPNAGDTDNPNITDFYSIPLCLKRRLEHKRQIDLSADYELINPNIHMLFHKYNALFFDHKLDTVRLQWDYREKLSAGFCHRLPSEADNEEKQTAVQCTISLSVNLLQFRSTKDLIETLLHEMIHSYLFVKQLHDKEKTPHGKRFLSIMNVMNYVCNECHLNVRRTHEFRSELNATLAHKWQCNGVCRQVVYRPSCRPPGKHEKWWSPHQSSSTKAAN